MDKRIIFAVAGSGKTTYIVNSLSTLKRSLIITYTDKNYKNISRKIAEKYKGIWPNNVTVMTYFQFLYRFCYKPFLSDRVKAKGIIFVSNSNRRAKQKDSDYYITENHYLYSNRIALLLDKMKVLNDIKSRITLYFYKFIIDEVQDIAGRDFDFLEKLMETEINMLFVGDFFQHTYNTSRDGNVNQNLFSDFNSYTSKFIAKGFIKDTSTLINSWRCSKNICDFIAKNLNIEIKSNRDESDNTSIKFISDTKEVIKLLDDNNIVKLHYQNGPIHGVGHKNWGDTKGEDCYQDVCVVLNKVTFDKYLKK